MVDKVVLLLSGGVDSATVGALLKADGKKIYALSFEYGQRHRHELRAAERIAGWLGVEEHRVATLDLRAWGGSALTSDVDVPKGGTLSGIIPVTYVPARNTLFLSYALAWSEVLGAREIAIGANAVDYSGYPDCRPEFILAFETMANLATKAGIEGHRLRIHAPLMHLTKAEILREGMSLGLDYALTHSCYDPSPPGRACGACDSCLIRNAAFEELGVPDPALN